MTQVVADLQELCETICPHCREKRDLRQRSDNGEWVHDWRPNVDSVAHAVCWADGLRKKYG